MNDGIGNQLFKIFATLSYYIDNTRDYVLYTLPINGYRKYYWDTLFSNISHKVSDRIEITNKYVAPYFHYKEIPVSDGDGDAMTVFALTCGRRRAHRLGRELIEGQSYGEAGAARSFPVRARDRAPMGFYDLPRDREAKSRILAKAML